MKLKYCRCPGCGDVHSEDLYNVAVAANVRDRLMNEGIEVELSPEKQGILDVCDDAMKIMEEQASAAHN